MISEYKKIWSKEYREKKGNLKLQAKKKHDKISENKNYNKKYPVNIYLLKNVYKSLYLFLCPPVPHHIECKIKLAQVFRECLLVADEISTHRNISEVSFTHLTFQLSFSKENFMQEHIFIWFRGNLFKKKKKKERKRKRKKRKKEQNSFCLNSLKVTDKNKK